MKQNPQGQPDATPPRPAASKDGRYCLADMLREIERDAENLHAGKLMDQERIQALFHNGGRHDRH